MAEEEKVSSRPLVSQSTPSLLVFHGKNRSQTFFSLAEKRSYNKSINKMRKSRCWATPQGWMLLQNRVSQHFSLMNPATTTEIELPPLEWDLDDMCTCILSLSPTDPDCVVMCADYYSLDRQRLFFCRPGGSSWMILDCDPIQFDLQSNRIMNILACKRRLYVLTIRRDLLIVDFTPGPNLRMVEQPAGVFWRPSMIGLFQSETHLIESGGEMFVVECFIEGLLDVRKVVHILVDKRDSSKQVWKEVDNIGDCVFFLGINDFSASFCASEIGVKGNCIYFIRKNDRDFYVFDIEKGTISVHQPFPNVRKRWSTLFWLMPTV